MNTYLWIFIVIFKHAPEVHLSKPLYSTTQIPEKKETKLKTCRNEEIECSAMEKTTNELKHTSPSEKDRLKEAKYQNQIGLNS